MKRRNGSTGGSNRDGPLPDDLAGVFGPVSLVQRTLEAVQGIQLPEEPWIEPGDEMRFNRRALVSLWVYALARNRGGSMELVEALATDPRLRYLCAHRYPGPDTLHRFRRSHGVAIEAALTALLAHAKHPNPAGNASEAARAEAQLRIRRAIASDSLAREE